MADTSAEGYRTVVGLPNGFFERPGPRLRLVGVLSAVRGIVARRRFRLDGQELLIGRDPQAGASIPDDNVSRHHARITRSGSEFLLEDLGSSNGTFVDAVPIVSCVLRDGDAVQIGRNLLLFDRVYELLDEPDAPSP